MKLSHISANSTSEENATRFYGEILGLKKIKSYLLEKDLTEAIFSIATECRVILFGNSPLSVEVFVPLNTVPVKNGFLHNCLEVPDREEFLRRCKKGGVEISSIPKGEKTLVFLKDFDGNLFEIKEGVGA